MQNLEKICKRLLLKEENSGHVECKYKIISRLISIEVLWKFFYLNIPIKGKL